MSIDKQIEAAEQKYKEAELAYIEAFHEWNNLLVKRTTEAQEKFHKQEMAAIEKKYSPVVEVR